MKKRKRHHNEQKKSSIASIFITILSLISISFFIGVLIKTIEKSGNIDKILPGIGMVFFILSVVFLIISIREQKKKQFNLASRRIGLIFTIISLLIWLSIFVIGYI